MATPKIIADFDTQLSTAVAIGATTFSIKTAIDDDNVALPTGLYYFTIDNGSSVKEYVSCTLTAGNATAVKTVSRQGVEVSGFARAHRVGASVLITDFATYMAYMNGIALAGAPDASIAAKGVAQGATLAQVRARTASGSTGAVLIPTPDVLIDLPTQVEKDALSGGGSLGTPSITNKFLTQQYVAAGIVRTLTYTASATWTKQTGLLYVIVETQGAGAGGQGGSLQSGGGSAGFGGGGGGAGGRNLRKILAADLAATVSVIVGAGGAGGAVSAYGVAGGAGVAGGQSSFGTKSIGNGGASSSGASGTATGTGGSGTTGIVTGISGEAGGGTPYSSHPSASAGNRGGDSYYGIGGAGAIGGSNPGTGYGSGGSGGGGADSSGSTPSTIGGAGKDGVVIVTEYYS